MTKLTQPSDSFYFTDSIQQLDAVWHQDEISQVKEPMLDKPRPFVAGLQSACVTAINNEGVKAAENGSSCESVQVWFDFDVNDKEKSKNSAWMRVKHMFAGSGTEGKVYGIQATPRPGQKVLVSFNNGDPHQPLILGGLPGKNSPPPLSPDKTPARSGWVSHSLAKDASNSVAGGHVLCFDDNVHAPAVNFNAYRHLHFKSANNANANIDKDIIMLVKQGNVTETADTLTVNAQEICWVVGQTQIKITPTDIIIESAAIEIN